MTETVAQRVHISGRVQGVGYRAWLQKKAQASGLSGWVRNRLDGSVEALLIGAKSDVEHVISDAQTGPNASHVDAVQTEDAMGLAPEGRFDIKPTV